MKYWIDDRVTVRAWDRPWEDRVMVSTNFYHLIPDADLDRCGALADIDVTSASLLHDVNPGRCDPRRLRDHERARL